MWGFGGRYYWHRGGRGRRAEGVVLVFAWMSSEDKHLKHYVDLYASCGWSSLVCHSQFLNSFFPDKAELLAIEVLNELVEELKINPIPVVFASFSGGPKACMYKVLQIIEGTCKKQSENMDRYRVLRDCITGYIYDSSPVDFTSDLGRRFLLHPSVLGISSPPRLVQWLANAIASSLDGLFLSRFEAQRAEYWQTLYASVTFGAPYLIMCSEDDDLAPCQTICNFAHRLKELGGDVRLVKWGSSPHVGHYRQHSLDYTSSVTELLQKASTIYSQRKQKNEGETIGVKGSHDEITETLGDLRKATTSSNDMFKRFSVEMAGHSLAPSSFEYHGGNAVGSIEDETDVVRVPTPPRINANGVLGQILFDMCVPQNIEEWDVGSSSSFNIRSTFPPTRRHGMHFNPIKCIRRSRL